MAARTPVFEGLIDAATHLRRDEEALRAGHPAARVALLDGPVLSLGVSQSPHGPLARRARALRIPVVVRRSGGTGVLHAKGDLVWSVVLPRSDRRVGRDFTRAYGRLGAGVVEVLAGVGLAARWSKALGLSPEYCILGHRGEALTIGPAAVGGAAQHLSGHALLHQGTILSRVDRTQLVHLFDLEPEVARRRVVSLADLRPEVAPLDLARTLAGLLSGFVDR